MRLANLDEALAELTKLEKAMRVAVGDGWSVYKVLMHCRQSIDASVAGYPEMKPAIVRKTVGKLVGKRFLSKGAMSHDLRSPVPGAAVIADEGDVAEALSALRASIHAFHAHEGELAPHFMFDVLDKPSYEQLHALHIADHLSAMEY